MNRDHSQAQNPFPGLRPFHQEEDFLFFGREEQTIELLSRLADHRFVAVVGTSGSGKSSLVRCGLLSELLGGKMRDAGADWEIAVTHPGGNPLALLADSLLEADLYDAEEEHARENLLATLSRSHFGLVEAVRQSDIDPQSNFLLVVDQFEEIFRFQEAGQRQQELASEFISLLLETVKQSDVPIYVVLTMRSDFIGECGHFESLAEMVNRGEFLIPRLNREQYKRVIEGPVKVAGGQITPRLLQRLLNDLGQQADQLPCLQHALMRTWDVWAERGDDDALDLDDYQRVGKMAQALSIHADEVYDSLATDRQRELCRGTFQALTVQESENRGIRRPQRLGNLCQILEVTIDELRPIIDAYRQSGVTFLMPSPEVELTERTIIDISHESLMRVWTRLRGWVDDESQAAGIYRRLAESATLHDKGKAGLYRDPELGIALAWRQENQPNSDWAERYQGGFDRAMKFLQSSEHAKISEAEARDVARQRELAQAKQLAEVQQRSASRLRWLVSGLAIVALLTILATINAVRSRREAVQAEFNAVESEAIAVEKAQQAADSAEQAASETKRAEEQAERARHQESVARRAEEEATVARKAAEAANTKFEEKLYLSDMTLAEVSYHDGNIRGVNNRLLDHIPERDATADPRGFEWFHLWACSHRSARQFNPVGYNSGSFRFPIQDAEVAPGGKTAAFGFAAGIFIVDLADGEAADRLREIHEDAIESQEIRFSRDGKTLLAVLGGDGVVGWDTETYDNRERLNAPTELRSLDVSPTENLLVAGGQDGRLYFWNTETWKPRESKPEIGRPIRSLVFSPDGTRLAIGTDRDSESGEALVLWDVAGGQRLPSLPMEHRGAVNAVVWKPNGAAVATACDDGFVRVLSFDANSSTTQSVVSQSIDGPVDAIAISDDGALLACGTRKSGAAYVFAADTLEEVTTLSGQANSVRTVDFVEDSLIVGQSNGVVSLWNLPKVMREPMEVVREEQLANLLTSSDRVWLGIDAQTVYAWRADGPINRYDLVARKMLPPWNNGEAYVCVEMADNRRRLATCGVDRVIRSWDIDTGQQLREFLDEDPSIDIVSVDAASNGNTIAWVTHPQTESSYKERSVRLLADEQDEIKEISIGVHYNSIRLSRDGKRLLVGAWGTGFSGPASHDVDQLEPVSGITEGDPTELVDSTWPYRFLFSPDEDVTVVLPSDMVNMILANLKRGIHLHDRDGNLLRVLEGHAGRVNCATFSADGRRLVSGGQDRIIRVWNVATGDLLLTLRGHDGPIDELAFAPDGSLVSLSREEGRVRYWKAPRREDLESDAAYWKAIAQQQAKSGDRVAAWKTFGEAIRRQPDDVTLYELRSEVADELGLVSESVDDNIELLARSTDSEQLENAIDKASDLVRLIPVAANTTERSLVWRYTTTQPSDGWQDSDYDASSWESGRSPLGNWDRDQTEWSGDDIWMRLEFDVDSSLDLPLVLRALTDDRGKYYVNGVLAATDGYGPYNYRLLSCDSAALATIKREGNVLAIHCQNTRGQGEVDAGVFFDRGPVAMVDRLSNELERRPENHRLLYARVRAHQQAGNTVAAVADANRLMEMLLPLVVDEAAAGSEPSHSVYLLTQATLAAAAASPEQAWRVLEPTELISEGGSEFEILDDGSILVSGPNVDKDRYILEVPSGGNPVFALKLEGLTHKSLPQDGPGRNVNGKFSLGKLTIRTAEPGADLAEGELNPFSAAWTDLTYYSNDQVIGGAWSNLRERGRCEVVLRWPQPIPSSQDRLRVEMKFWSSENWPGQNLGRFRLSVAEDPRMFATEWMTKAVLSESESSWQNLALALFLTGNEGIDKLTQHKPELVIGIGDAYRQSGHWELAIEAYTRAIESGGIDAWCGRANAYFMIGQDQKAEADLNRAVELAGGTDSYEYFNRFSKKRWWKAAIPFGWQWVDQSPGNIGNWMRLGSVIAHSGDRQKYEEFCDLMLARFADGAGPDATETTIRACLLLPDAIDLQKLPIAAFEKALEEKTISREDFAWGTRGLLAYRMGRYGDAIEYAKKGKSIPGGFLGVILNEVVGRLGEIGLGDMESTIPANSLRWLGSSLSNDVERPQYIYIAEILHAEGDAAIAKLEDQAAQRQRQLEKWEANEDWDSLAEDYWAQYDELEDDREAFKPRHVLLRKILARRDGVIEAMQKLRPEDTLLQLARGRYLALDLQWGAAADAFALGAIESEPQEFFELAMAQSLAGRNDAFNQTVSDLVARIEAADDPFSKFVGARMTGVTPESFVERDKAVGWGQAAVDADDRGWILHALALAHFRAGNLDEATTWTEKSRSSGWHPELQDMLMCLIEIKRGNDTEARRYRDQADRWLKEAEAQEREVRDRGRCPDVLELHLLIREADKLLAQ